MHLLGKRMRSMLQVRVTDLETADGHGEREDMIGCYRKVSHQKTRSVFYIFVFARVSHLSEIVRTDGQMDNVISRGRFGQKNPNTDIASKYTFHILLARIL